MAYGTRIIPTPEPITINLIISELEARTLKQMCFATGGSPQASARKHVDAIAEALTQASVRSADHPMIRGQDTIFFLDEEVSTL